MPVYGTIASKFNDDGVTALYHGLLDTIEEKTGVVFCPVCPDRIPKYHPPRPSSSPPSAPATWPKSPKPCAITTPAPTTRRKPCAGSGIWRKRPGSCRRPTGRHRRGPALQLKEEIAKARQALDPETTALLNGWEETQKAYQQDELVYQVAARRSKSLSIPNRCAAKKSPRSPCPISKIPARSTAGCGAKICPVFPLHGRRFPHEARG